MSDPSIQSQLAAPLIDSDPTETGEWRESLASVLRAAGPQRVRELMDVLAGIAQSPEIGWHPARGGPYEP